MASILTKISSYHSMYISRFYNKKIAGVGTFVGACCGLTYLTEYYSKKAYNKTANEWNKIANEKNNKNSITIFGTRISDGNDEFILPKINKYKNPFSVIIMPSAPYSVNLLTTMITGGLLGYTYAVYFPISIPSTIVYNLVTYNDDDNDGCD